MDITPASEHVGAFVSGVDLSDLDASSVATIERAGAEHGALLFRDQKLSEDDHIAFAPHFAEIDVTFTTHFVGWAPEESKPLLDFLLGNIANGAFDYRFEWEPGSVAMWDTSSTWHWAHNDYHGHRRLMHRITVHGEALEQRPGE